ncbi:uncharacterized protein LOC21394731 [Morus notabilis]|uniref:uncharacterized protein LOC21394731 n=1 Tax=Morus notabilis TaxID=981085 RepID=UPI000CED4E83|nr:uncharacterized protein LOC21394731 [Morus notabilis]
MNFRASSTIDSGWNFKQAEMAPGLWRFPILDGVSWKIAQEKSSSPHQLPYLLHSFRFPPQLSPQVGEIPRSNFQFDFELERKILAEAEKENQNWVKLGLENHPSRTVSSTSSVGSVADPTVSKYIASGLSREAVTLAVGHYGDNPTKVRDFVNGYNLLREMGFPSKSVAEALVMYENDTDKALAHFLNSSS